MHTFESIAVDRGWLTPAQVEEARQLHAKLAEMGLPSPLEEIVLKKGWITKQQLASINTALGKGNADAIPGFVIIEKIAQGGMGVVYKAKQTSMDRTVAIKVLLPKFAADKDARERFLREVRAVAKLNHPNIVAGIDAGETHGIFYFVMEFLDGEPMDKVLRKRGKLPWREAATIVRQVASALDHAHQNKLVHRDVKPGNIMLLKDGSAKLADLGLARASAGDAALTQSGMIVGSPGYVSPEQATGERELDIRTDIYSLGLTFFEFLVGAPAYSGDNPLTVVSARLTRAPAFEKLIDAPKDVIAVVTKMTQREVLRRYQTPQPLLEDLDAVLSGHSTVHAQAAVVHHPPHTERRVLKPRPAAKSPAPTMVAGIVGAVVVVAAVLFAILRPGGTPPPTPPSRETVAKPPPPASVDAKQPEAGVTEADRRAMRAYKVAQAFEEENEDPRHADEVLRLYETALKEAQGTPLAGQVEQKLRTLREELAVTMKSMAEDFEIEMREFESRGRYGESRKLAEMAAAIFADPAWKRAMEERGAGALKRAEEARDALVREVDAMLARGDHAGAAAKLATTFGIESIDRGLASRRALMEKERADLAAAADRDRRSDRAAIDEAVPKLLDLARARDTSGASKAVEALVKRLRTAEARAEGQLYHDWVAAAHKLMEGARAALGKLVKDQRVTLDLRSAERVDGKVTATIQDAVLVGERTVAIRDLTVAALVGLSGVSTDPRGAALLAVLEKDAAGVKRFMEAVEKAKLDVPPRVRAELEAFRGGAAEEAATRQREKDAETLLLEAERLAIAKKMAESHEKFEKFLAEYASTAFARRADARVKKLQSLFPREVVLYATDVKTPLPSGWRLLDEAASAGGKTLAASAGRNFPSLDGPYVEFKFAAVKGMKYRLWMRMRCGPQRANQNLLAYQVSDAVDFEGNDFAPVGGGAGRVLQFWEGDAASTPERGWTCHDQFRQPDRDLDELLFTFRSTGEKTLRIYVIEDVTGFDQIVISAEKYVSEPPSEDVVKKK